MMLEKNGGTELHRSCEKCVITLSQCGKVYDACIKRKEG